MGGHLAPLLKRWLVIDEHLVSGESLVALHDGVGNCYVSKTKDGLCHEVPLVMRILRCCLRFGQFATFEVLLVPEGASKVTLQSHFESWRAHLLCRVQLQGAECCHQKGDWGLQDNFCGDFQLHNTVIDLLKTKKVGFGDGCGLTAGNRLVDSLADDFVQDSSSRAAEVIAGLGSLSSTVL